MWKILLLGLGVAAGLAVAAVSIANARFDRAADRRIREMLAAARDLRRTVTDDDLAPLPAPVARWLRASGTVGRLIPATIRLRQRGAIRSAPGARWMEFRADQYYTLDPAAFLWRVSATAFPGIFVRGVDVLRDGRGSMQMKPLALFPIVDAAGPALDQGAALRYLQEIVWFPFAALAGNIAWTPIDERSARATLSLETLEVSGLFTFADDGRVINFEAPRYRDESPEPALRTWRTPMRDHAAFGGIVVPTAGEGVWALDDGDFVYIRLRILAIDYDVPEVFER